MTALYHLLKNAIFSLSILFIGGCGIRIPNIVIYPPNDPSAPLKPYILEPTHLSYVGYEQVMVLPDNTTYQVDITIIDGRNIIYCNYLLPKYQRSCPKRITLYSGDVIRTDATLIVYTPESGVYIVPWNYNI